MCQKTLWVFNVDYDCLVHLWVCMTSSWCVPLWISVYKIIYSRAHAHTPLVYMVAPHLSQGHCSRSSWQTSHSELRNSARPSAPTLLLLTPPTHQSSHPFHPLSFFSAASCLAPFPLASPQTDEYMSAQHGAVVMKPVMETMCRRSGWWNGWRVRAQQEVES